MSRICTLLVIVITLLGNGCLSFVSYQSAHIVPPGERRATLACTRAQLSRSPNFEADWTSIDCVRRIALANQLDGALRFVIVREDGEAESGLLFGGDVRYGLWRNHLALALPVALLPGDPTFSTVQVMPGVVATADFGEHIQVNAAVRVHL